MQHGEASERLADLALEPARLARLDHDGSAEASALRAHLVDCERCADELGAWRRTWSLVGDAVSSPDQAGMDDPRTLDGAPEVLRAPASLRSRTLAAIAAEGRPRGAAADRPAAPANEPGTTPSPVSTPAPASRRATAGRLPLRRGLVPWIAVAAALVIALGAGSMAWTRTRDLDRAQVENAGLTDTMATMNRVLATPAHWVVTLRTPDGTAGGTMAWSGAEIAVVTTAVSSPNSDQSYRCWVERDGVRTPIGPMWFSGSTGYWAGPIEAWGALLVPGARLGVSLVPAAGGPPTPVLEGSL